MIKYICSFLVFSLLISLGASSAIRASEYVDKDLAYRIDFPDTWSQISNETLEFINDTNSKLSKKYPHIKFPQYALGFQESKDPNLYPCILIQHLPPNAMAFPDESEFSEGIADKETAMEEATLTTRFKKPRIDASRAAVVLYGETEISGIGTTATINLVGFGKNGIASIFCFVPKDEPLRYTELLESIIDSFRFEKGYKYDSGAATKLHSRKPFYMTIIDAAIGASIAAGIYFFFSFLIRRRRKNQDKLIG